MARMSEGAGEMSSIKQPIILTNDFKITVPADVRENMSLRVGQKIKFIATGNGMLLEPQPYDATPPRIQTPTKQT